MKKISYTFTNNENKEKIKEKEKEKIYTFFYQIGSCKDPETQTYPMRKFIIDPESNEFKDVRTHNLTSRQNKKFYSLYKPHEYRRYSVNNLNSIDYPSFHDINTVRSSILNNNSSYTGAYAPF
jgi:hypothetical protein